MEALNSELEALKLVAYGCANWALPGEHLVLACLARCLALTNKPVLIDRGGSR
jgi:hypothetical protein